MEVNLSDVILNIWTKQPLLLARGHISKLFFYKTMHMWAQITVSRITDPKEHSCMGICYAKLFEAAKIYAQILRFTCCLNMVFT